MNALTTDDVKTEQQAGEYLAEKLKRDRPYSVHTLRAWRNRDYGPAFIRVGNEVVYRVDDLDAFIEASRVETNRSTERENDGNDNGTGAEDADS